MSYFYGILAASFFSLCCGFMAKNKNRNIALWSILGFIGFALPFIILAFLPFNCSFCGNDFATNSDGIHCGSCGKAERFTNDELTQLKHLTDKLAKRGMSVRSEGVKVIVTQSSGARKKFTGLEALKDYVDG